MVTQDKMNKIWSVLKLLNKQFGFLASFISSIRPLIYWNVCVLIGNRDATAAFLAFLSAFIISVLVVFLSFYLHVVHDLIMSVLCMNCGIIKTSVKSVSYQWLFDFAEEGNFSAISLLPGAGCTGVAVPISCVESV